jgi:rabenosyn-5
MSGRKLGGGRVLGSGKGLAPAAVIPQRPPPRASSPFAPSEGSILSLSDPQPSPSSSLTPPATPSPLPDFPPEVQDLSSTVHLGPSAPGGSGEGGGGKLVCPICEEEMVTLLQLNRHIDDVHQELPAVQQDEVKTWFDKQVSKARKFQPLSLINQKLRGLEAFEANESQPMPANGSASQGHGQKAPEVVDPELFVTRSHWQKSRGDDLCTDPACGKRLGPLNGSVNCRSCGRLFCEEHTMYQMKLSKAAKHDPVKGYWCRVCETCYKSRPGYSDHDGVLVDHTSAFVAMRKKRMDRQNLEVQRLEKRLTKLTRLLANPPEEIPNTNGTGVLSSIASLSGRKDPRKALEQSVVTWQDDTTVSRCPFCQQEFGSWTLRRHHCRICGRVVCADPVTGCSSEVGLNVAAPLQPTTEKSGLTSSGSMAVDVRMCRECKATIFSKRDFTEEIAHKPPDQRAYETLRQFEQGIRQLMPSFQRALLALQPPSDNANGADKPAPSHAQIQEAAKIRKRLTDSFTKYDLAAKRLRDMKTDSPTQAKLQKAIYTAASSFLHANMLPLKSLPRMLKSNSSTSNHRRLLSSLNNGNGSTLSPLRNGESATSSQDLDTASLGGASESSTVVSALEMEEKEVREKLLVLQEQRFLVQEMVSNARGAKRTEEVGALARNMEELDREIESLNKQVKGVEMRWEGVYAAGVAN